MNKKIHAGFCALEYSCGIQQPTIQANDKVQANDTMSGSCKITFDWIYPKPVENQIHVAAFSSNAAYLMNALALKTLSW